MRDANRKQSEIFCLFSSAQLGDDLTAHPRIAHLMSRVQKVAGFIKLKITLS